MRNAGVVAAVLSAAGVAFLVGFSLGRSGADETVVSEAAAAGTAPRSLTVPAGPRVSGLQRVAVQFPDLAKPAATSTPPPIVATPSSSPVAPTPTATSPPVIRATPTPTEVIGSNPH